MTNPEALRDAYHYDEEPAHKLLRDAITPSLSYSKGGDYRAWKEALRSRFMELSGLDRMEAMPACDAALEIEHSEKKEG